MSRRSNSSLAGMLARAASLDATESHNALAASPARAPPHRSPKVL
jgi:hypothetical protein